MQLGQRVAGIGIWLLQNGHSFVVGAGVSFGLRNRITAFTMRNITRAMMRKLISVLMNAP